MVYAGETGAGGNIGDGLAGGFKKLLSVIGAYPENFVKDGAAEFSSEGAFQGSARELAVGDDVIHG